jgi:hypothetical protein
MDRYYLLFESGEVPKNAVDASSDCEAEVHRHRRCAANNSRKMTVDLPQSLHSPLTCARIRPTDVFRAVTRLQQPPSAPAKSVAYVEPAEAPAAACPAPPTGRHLMERAGVALWEVRLAVELQKKVTLVDGVAGSGSAGRQIGAEGQPTPHQGPSLTP